MVPWWWLKNKSRAMQEVHQLTELAEQNNWLRNLQVSVGDGNFEARFDIKHGSENFKLVLTYPVVFPDAPPLVKTRNAVRISGHQYGTSGELCLEYRPDNWQHDVTGAMMVESAYKLLCGENPNEGSETPEIVDGHALSIGQETRTAFARFVMTIGDRAALQSLDEKTLYLGKIGQSAQDDKYAARLMHIGNSDSSIWQSKSKFVADAREVDLVIIKNPKETLTDVPSHDDVVTCIETANSEVFDHEHLDNGGSFYLLVSDPDKWSLFYVSSKSEQPFVCPFQTILENDLGRRLPVELEHLRHVKVGVVGCGSVGSKIAMQLARSGVGSFLLIDDDVFFEKNLVRHELSVADIGFHKTGALREKLLTVDPQLSIKTNQTWGARKQQIHRFGHGTARQLPLDCRCNSRYECFQHHCVCV